jgi:hypothetical protein
LAALAITPPTEDDRDEACRVGIRGIEGECTAQGALGARVVGGTEGRAGVANPYASHCRSFGHVLWQNAQVVEPHLERFFVSTLLVEDVT